ncbi:hypothetical protein [Intestinibacillus massiliensis]|uniref:hypothetical protein n=1 Tax=Intestinibacillus massiliensis TaxID=1871029 RepID=UPI000B35ED9E|nr:hypothetical protein [Intestinibacillus massiliensis]
MEDWIALGDLSKLLGVNIRTIQRLTQEGVLTAEPDPEDKRRKVWPTAESVQAYIGHQLARADSNQRNSRIQDLEEKKLAAETELKESQRDLHVLKTDIASGKYLPVEQVQLDYSRFFVVLKKFLLAVPNRVSGLVGGYVDPVTARALEKDIAKEINTMLTSFVIAGEAGGAP